MKTLKLFAVFVVLALLPTVCSAFARVKWDSPYNGPGNDWDHAYHSVQAGINACAAGSEVWVAAGSYVERITMKSGVALYGGFLDGMTSREQRDWISNETVLDANDLGCVVSVTNAASGTRIDGFTIKRGHASYGSGLTCSGGSPTLANNYFTDNTHSISGGAIYCKAQCSLAIVGNTMRSNAASRRGAAVYAEDSSVTLTGNVIVGNTVFSGGNEAGAVYCKSSTLTATGNTISRVTYGGGIYGIGTVMTIANNTISECASIGVRFDNCSGSVTGNIFDANGSGITCINNSSPMIADNTISGSTSGIGVDCSINSSPTITRNSITGNAGSGVKCSNSSPTIAHNTIARNVRPYYGGAVYCSGSSSPIIADNIMSGNSASYGGAIQCLDTCSPLIVGNRITGNTSGTGGGIDIHNAASPIIRNNVISGNSASSGGGIRCWSPTAVIVGNTICGNNSSKGGGIDCINYGKLVNNIIAFNLSGVLCTTTDSTNMRNNCVYGNRSYDFSGLPTSPIGTNGNISVDPKLANPSYGSFHLQPGSPCLDVGDDGEVAADELDFEGQARIQGEHVDIGADEADGTTWPSNPPMIVRVSPTGNDSNDGSGWGDFEAKRTIQAAADVVAATGGEIWVKAGVYDEYLTLQPFVHLYGGFAGCETELSQRDHSHYNTTVDARSRDNVVSVSTGYSVNTIDGFRLINGKQIGNDGGGVSCERSSPKILNNVIADCVGYNGSAIYTLDGAPYIANNLIIGNRCTEYWGGGAIYCGYSSWPYIANNVVVFNTANRLGAGIYCESLGGGMTLINNTIAFNSCSEDGAGIYYEGGLTMMSNNIVAFNSSGICASRPCRLSNTCVFGNVRYDYKGSITKVNNVLADPIFADSVNGDYHLRFDSPCIDAGTNEGAPVTDFDGLLRPVDGDCDGVPVTDIGAFEYVPIHITIDVLPDESPNVFLLQPQRLITVAILGSADFEAGRVDALSVEFGPGDATEVHQRGHLEDVNRDGLADMALHFRCGDSGITPGTSTVYLYGRLTNGERIEGSDVVTASAK